MSDGLELLQVRCDLLRAHDRNCTVDSVESFGVVDVQAFRPLQEQEVAQRLFAERQQRKPDPGWVVLGGLWQVGSAEVRAGTE